MLKAALVFFVLALAVLLFGATGFAGMTVEMARTLLGVFLLLTFASLVAGLISGGRHTKVPKGSR